jgi:hypothetical protein
MRSLYQVVLVALLCCAKVHSAACTGSSSSLAPAECAFWTEFYDNCGQGLSEFKCTRLDPCACKSTSDNVTVACSPNGENILDLSLPDTGLNGTLPSLAALTKLVRIDLSTNKLKGTPEFPSPCSLKYVLFGSNFFQGTTPEPKGCADLLKYDVHMNLWKDIPSFSAFKKIQYIDLSGALISGTIPSFSANTALTHVDLGGNGLGGKIPSFAACKKLVLLDLSANEDLRNCAQFAKDSTMHPANCDVECGF